MAEMNVRINVKTSTGYDQLYPKSKAEIIDFDNSDTTLDSKNTEGAIKELDTKIIEVNTNINNLPTIRNGTIAPSNSLGKNGDIYIQIIE